MIATAVGKKPVRKETLHATEIEKGEARVAALVVEEEED